MTIRRTVARSLSMGHSCDLTPRFIVLDLSTESRLDIAFEGRSAFRTSMATPQTFDETSRLETGVAHHRAGRFDAARRCYEDVLLRNPDNPSALHLLGFLHAYQGRTEEGVTLLRRAVDLV